jgi:ketosteroid isomerase-like protein
MGRKNLDHIRAVDTAWNLRQWADYAALLDERLVAFRAGEAEPHGKAEHVARAQRLCIAYPDCRVDVEPYLELFLSLDGQLTCSVALLSGTAPDGRRFQVPFSVVSRWRAGKIVQQREFLDAELLAQQLGNQPLNGESP